MSSNWTYLETEPYCIRYALAAWLLRDCVEVLEIGDEATTLLSFLQPLVSCTVVNPNVCAFDYQEGAARLRQIAASFQEVPTEQLNPANANYGIALLGLELYMDEAAWKRLAALVHNAQRTVVEFPPAQPYSIEQFEHLLKLSGCTRVQSYSIGIAAQGVEVPVLANATRELFVLENREDAARTD